MDRLNEFLKEVESFLTLYSKKVDSVNSLIEQMVRPEFEQYHEDQRSKYLDSSEENAAQSEALDQLMLSNALTMSEEIDLSFLDEAQTSLSVTSALIKLLVLRMKLLERELSILKAYSSLDQVVSDYEGPDSETLDEINGILSKVKQIY